LIQGPGDSCVRARFHRIKTGIAFRIQRCIGLKKGRRQAPIIRVGARFYAKAPRACGELVADGAEDHGRDREAGACRQVVSYQPIWGDKPTESLGRAGQPQKPSGWRLKCAVVRLTVDSQHPTEEKPLLNTRITAILRENERSPHPWHPGDLFVYHSKMGG